MPDGSSIHDEFLRKLTHIVLENLSNEQFGVSELAREVGMSRSNLLRRVKKATKQSVSQFIRQIRLEQAMLILQDKKLTVSEVAYEVGFNSVSYFIKCFHDQYGYSPGEVGNLSQGKGVILTQGTKRPHLNPLILILLIVGVMGIGLWLIKPKASIPERSLEKSIAVLPFKNESSDTSNLYFINGLMEAVLTNLQRIEDLRVVSRTSVEQYRHHPKLISEMAKELDVRYIVEGSGQKVGGQILLNVQLIEAGRDNHLWAEQYKREVKDVFQLQLEVAKRIADQIEVVISPETEAGISKLPTKDLVAYDHFLKGLDLLHTAKRNNLEPAVEYFKQAIQQDSTFARAYAAIAITYYYLDAEQAVKKYTDEIRYFAEHAMSLDDHLPQSLIAKALSFIQTGDYSSAIPYLERALEYNPNSTLVIGFLSDFYAHQHPDTQKYLEYALKGIRLDIASQDSMTRSFIYLHLSNALVQAGFVAEAEEYIDKSLDYDPGNLYSAYVKAYIQYAALRDLQQLKSQLLVVLKQDSTRLDVLQEVGKVCYFMKDYPTAFRYYKKFVTLRTAQQLDIYRSENAKIGLVFSKMGEAEASAKLFADFQDFAQNDRSLYQHINQAIYYAHQGDKEQAMNHLRQFAEEDDFHYWTLLFFKKDPLFDPVKDLPEFKAVLRQIEEKFWKEHDQIKQRLEAERLI